MSTRACLLALVCLCHTWLARPVSAQGGRAWHITAAVGQSDIHENRSSGFGWAAHVGRSRANARGVFAELGLAGGTSDEGFLALDGGVGIRVLPNSVISPVLGVGAGVMGEPEYTGLFLRATGGVDVRLTSRARARLVVQRGSHGGQSGPHLATIGLQWSVGRASGSH